MVAGELRGSAVVVMLTQTHEAGKEKCFQYYPLTSNESPLRIPPDSHFRDNFAGEVELVSVREDPTSRCQLREMRLHITGSSQPPVSGSREEPHNQSRKSTLDIHHLLFSGWPDFLIPEGEDRAALVELVGLSARLNRAPSSDSMTNGAQIANISIANDLAHVDQHNPRIVHCSAGVGRSGTFIALDYLLSLLYSGHLDNLSAESDPVADTVEELRKQRMMMVQGETQFMLLYDILREQWKTRQASLAGSVI